MRLRRIVGMTLSLGFVAAVVHAAAVHQCPASGLGACARVHAELMRPRPPAPSMLVLVAPPMRAASERG